MGTFLSIIFGLVFGTAAAGINVFITKSFMKKNNSALLAAASAVHIGVYIAVFAASFLLKNALAYNYPVVMITEAIVMSVSSVVASFLLAKSTK